MHLTYRHTKYAAYIGFITQAIINNLTPLLFVTFQRQFSLGLEKISLLITLNFFTQILTDLAAAKICVKVGYRPLLLLAHGTAFFGLCALCVLPFVMEPFAGLCICSITMAIGGGLIEVLVSPIVEALPGDEKASAMSMLHSFYCWGQVSVVLLSTLFFVTAGVAHWRVLPLLWAAIPLFNFVLFAKVPIRTLDEGGESMPLHKLFSVKIFYLFLVLMICSGAAELAMSQWASLFAEEGLGVSKTLGDLLGPCAFAVLMGLARVFFGLKGETVDLRKALALSSILCIASYLLAVFSPWPVLSLVGCALTGLAVGLMWPGTFSLSSRYYPQGGTAMFAILALAGDVGCTSGPTLAGFISDAFGGNLKAGLLAAVVFPVIMLIGVMVLRPGAKPAQASREENK